MCDRHSVCWYKPWFPMLLKLEQTLANVMGQPSLSFIEWWSCLHTEWYASLWCACMLGNYIQCSSLLISPSHTVQTLSALGKRSSCPASISSCWEENLSLLLVMSTVVHVDVYLPWDLYESMLEFHEMICVLGHLFGEWLSWCDPSLLGIEFR